MILCLCQRSFHLLGLLGLLAVLSGLTFAEEFPQVFNTQKETEPLLTPQEARQRLTVPEGFQVTLFAAEPDVQQPIALATDERGRLWVAENYTYAERETNFETKLRDRIIILEDTDGDGRFDKRKVFWDQGSKLSSIEIGFGGVWTLCAPHLLFIPDRDRDDVPDGEPIVVLEGWNDGSVRHNIVNGLRWGPDGWLYGRHGIQATSLVGTPETAPEHRVTLDCCIWRYHPTRKAFEVVCRGTTNSWGMDWDDHGQMFFINTVIGHLWHVLPGAYYQRMYGEHFDSQVYQLLPQTADHYHWDTREAWSDIRNLGVTPTTDQAGGGHAHCGMMIYLGDNWPARYRNQVFTCNLHGLRVNCDRLERSGATYVARHEADFLRSSDRWFRGIELLYGPDGGVYLADWSDLGECHENDGVHRTTGRIYKVTFGKPLPAAVGDLAQRSDQELAEMQLQPNDWYVRQARRLLQERAETGQPMGRVHQQLRRLFDQQADVTRQLRVLWTLYATGGANEPWLLKHLRHPSEHVRLWVVLLLTDQGPPSDEARAAFISLAAEESSGLVLTYLAATLGRWPHEQRGDLAQILVTKGEFADDPVYPLMVWYAVEPVVTGYPETALQLVRYTQLPVVRELIARRLTGEIERQPAVVAELVGQLAETTDPHFQRSVLLGMEAALRGWRRAPAPAGWAEVEPKLSQSPDEEIRRLSRELSLVFGDGRASDFLRRLAGSNGADLPARRAAIQSLVAARDPAIVPVLHKLLTDRDLGVDAIRGLAAFDDPQTPRLLVERFRSLTRAEARQEAISTLCARLPYAKALLSAVAAGTVPREQVSLFQLRQIQLLGDEEANRAIERLWPELERRAEEKSARIAEYQGRLTPDALAQADLSAGRLLFRQNCANCHRLFGQGGQIGPDLTGAQRHNLQYLLENIVDPSATVSKNYHLSTALMNDGRVVSGIVVAESERTLTIQTATERLVLRRDEIDELRPSQLSLMPERQLDVLKTEQVRDLIAYLMSPSQVPLPGGDSSESGR